MAESKKTCWKKSKRRSPIMAQMAEARTLKRKDRNVARSSHGVFLSVSDLVRGVRRRATKNHPASK